MKPAFNLIPETLVNQVIDQALKVLNNSGVIIESEELLDFLSRQGLKTRKKKKKVYLSRAEVECALETVPSRVKLYDRYGDKKLCMELNNVHYNPGSAAIKIYDGVKNQLRKPISRDYVRLVKLTETLENMDAQSTLIVPGDVPDFFADRYRLYLSLLYGSKPIVTGIFSEEGFDIMVELLKVIRDGSDSLKKYPLAIFDACPSPPLKWSKLTVYSLVKCAREGIPAELVSMPLSGATAPVTLAETLVQHTAENLSGVTISQVVKQGAPIIYGGSPSIFDMRYGTTPMGAIETIMVDCAFINIGKKLGLPTHAYLGLSDSKLPDVQAGIESTMGILLGTLSGVNMMSGPGMLDFESSQCEEKLVIDNEICGMARRLIKGIEIRDNLQADILLNELTPDSRFLSHSHTLKWFREEQFFPSTVIDRQDAESWQKSGCKSAAERAKDHVQQLLNHYDCPRLPEGKENELKNVIMTNAKMLGIKKLPLV